jgi:hypothetical protein
MVTVVAFALQHGLACQAPEKSPAYEETVLTGCMRGEERGLGQAE